MPNMTDAEFARALGVSPIDASDEMFMKALKEAEKRQTLSQPWEAYGVPRNPMEESFMTRLGRGANIGLTEAAYGLKQPFTGLSPEEEAKIAAGRAYMKGDSGFAPDIGRVATDIGLMAPVGAVGAGMRGLTGFLARTAGQAATGAAIAPGDIEERMKSGAIAGAGSMVGEALPYAFSTAKRAVEPFYERGKQNILGRMAQRVVGEDAESVARELTSNVSSVPGAQYTASEAAPQSGGLAAMQRWAEQSAPEPYMNRRVQNVGARSLALKGIAGDEAQMAAAEEARERITAPLYERAMITQAPVDDTLRDLLKRPSMKSAFQEAKMIAAEEGMPVPKEIEEAIMTGELPAEISGQGLHYMKMALDAMQDPANTAIGRTQKRAIKQTSKQFEAWREANIPEYAEAQAAFRELSKPISRMKVGTSMYEKLVPALGDYGPLSREKAEAYASALRGKDVTAQRATGFKSARFSDIMKPSDEATYSAVANDLTRQAESAISGRGIGSNTFQNFIMQDLAERAGFPGSVIGKVTKVPLIGTAYTTQEAEMQRQLADILLDPNKTAALLRRSQSPLSRMLSAQTVQPYSSVIGAALGSNLR